MMKKMLKKLLWKGRLQIRPTAKRFDEFGRELPPIADDWIMTYVDRKIAKLQNIRTSQVMKLPLKSLRNYDHDATKNWDGLTHGFLNIRVQTNISGCDLWFS